MNTNRIVRIESLLSITGGAGLLLWWFSMPLFLPVADAAENFQDLILDPQWIPVNLIGLISTLLLTLGFPGFYVKHYQKFKCLGFTGLVIASAGLVMYTGIQYYETLLWPAAARINPELLQVKGALVSGDPGVAAGLLSSGALLGIGYILFGISALQTKAYPRIPLWLIIIGAPVFGVGIAFPVRTAGLILFCAGTIWLAWNIRKSSQSHSL